MMDRPRNRPRIAGQRRTSSGPGTTDAAVEPEVADTPTEVTTTDTEAASETPETLPQDVTPATSEASEGAVQAAEPGDLDTDSDENGVSEAPDPEREEAVQGPDQEVEKPGRLGVMLSAALGVLVVLVLVVSGLLGVKAWQGKQADDARDQAAAAGRKAAETVLSYDYRDLDKSFAASQALMTPDYSGKFAETAKVVRTLATKNKTTVRADVREVGVKDGDADRVTLIIFVNQTTTSTLTKGVPRIDLNRTRFTMVRNGDQWLVQEIAGL
ncbi:MULTISPECIES: hypothetical protein [unclassified Kribbella]|uniref:hypothetical protein n=1 Tax=unclassified Kribbella TaxID=2644121 RepID=UPI0030162D2E